MTIFTLFMLYEIVCLDKTSTSSGQLALGPAKRQKKMSCVSTGRTGHSVHSPGGTPYFLSIQLDVIVSFSFGASAFSRFLKMVNLFTHGVQIGGRATGKSCPRCISETVRCRKLIHGRDIGWGCRCATSWSDQDSTFDLTMVTLTYKILSELVLETVRFRKLILTRDIG